MKQEIKSHWRTWIFYVTIGAVLILIYKTIDSIGFFTDFMVNFLSIISPFLIGLLLAYLLYIPESKIERKYKKVKIKLIRKNARKFAILTTYLMVVLILILIINVILPVLTESINEFIANVQSYYSSIIRMYNDLPADSVFKTEQTADALKELQNIDLQKYFSTDNITQYVKGVVGIATGIFDVFVMVAVSVYILAERNEILKFLKRVVKAIFMKDEICISIEEYFYKANGIFFKFISSQFIDAILVGTLATIALKIIGVKYAVLLGFSIGLFNMIPYFGAIIAVGMAALITLITGGFSQAIIMLIVVVILQQIDANVINPKIIGDSLQISPLLVILAVTVGGAYFGVIGMFLGVPVATVLKILVNDYIDKRLDI